VGRSVTRGSTGRLRCRRRRCRRRCCRCRRAAVIGEDRVDLPAGLVEQGDDPVGLCRIPADGDLAHRLAELEAGLRQVTVVAGELGELGERCERAAARPLAVVPGAAVVVGGGLVASGLGERVGPASLILGDGGQALVDEELEGRVDLRGGGLPAVGAAVGDVPDELGAVLRALGQQTEDGGADIVPVLPGVPSAASGRLATRGGEVAAQTTQHVEESGEVLRFVGVLCHVGASLGEKSAGVPAPTLRGCGRPRRSRGAGLPWTGDTCFPTR
jgi:hypothetical protein